ncbi:hypothetical protein ACOSQ3_022951 [Xanthoceras sorbifolium]
MVGKFALQSVQVHSRSISLPASLHPNSLNNIDTELNKLIRTREESSSSGAGGRLYDSIDDLIICSPCIQQALHKQKHEKFTLDRSVGLLAACGNTRELVSNMKDRLSKSKKDIAKCLRELKRVDINIVESYTMVLDLDHEQMFMMTNLLRGSSVIIISIFQSILLFKSMPVLNTKARGWSLIRKLIPAATVTSQEIFNEAGSVDIALYFLYGQIRKSDAKISVQIARRRLETLDVRIKDLETGWDCLFRRLIQNRVILLNIPTP